MGGLSHRELTATADGMKPMLSHGFVVQYYDISFSDHVLHTRAPSALLLHWYTPTLGPAGAVMFHALANAPKGMERFTLADLGSVIGSPQGHLKAEGRTLMALARLSTFIPLRFDYGVIEIPTNVGYPSAGQRAKWGAFNEHISHDWLNPSTKEATT